MEHQIAIPIPQTAQDRLLSRAPWLLLSVMVVLIGLNYSELPSEVPIHFGSNGQPDNYTGKTGLFILPVIYGLLSLLLTYLAKIPHKHNYLVDITPKNRLKQYRLSQNLMRALAALIGLNFLMIVWQTIEVAVNNQSGISIGFLVAFLLSIFGSIGVYVYLAYKNK